MTSKQLPAIIGILALIAALAVWAWFVRPTPERTAPGSAPATGEPVAADRGDSRVPLVTDPASGFSASDTTHAITEDLATITIDGLDAAFEDVDAELQEL